MSDHQVKEQGLSEGRFAYSFIAPAGAVTALEALLAAIDGAITVEPIAAAEVGRMIEEAMLRAAALATDGVSSEEIEEAGRMRVRSLNIEGDDPIEQWVTAIMTALVHRSHLEQASKGWRCSPDKEPEIWAAATQYRGHEDLLRSIHEKLPDLKSLFETVSASSVDSFYRYYHGSFKVYQLQRRTEQVVAALQGLMPTARLNRQFSEIMAEGTGKEFRAEHNADWSRETRPILEAFFHARTMLELAISSGESLSRAPECLPSDWAAVLYLYNLR